MNRFRAWDKGNKMWIYLIIPKSGCTVMDFKVPFKWEDLEDWQQFTGRYDKNSMEIFVGDIMDVYAVGKAVIEFNEDRFVCRYGKKLLQFVFISSQDEVIGDIYNNPELLK